jgi:hypothetical protein
LSLAVSPLVGSASGSYRTNGIDPLASLVAKGNVHPVGHATFKGSASFALLEGAGGTLNATTRHGKLTIAFAFESLQVVVRSVTALEGTYTVTKAGKALAGEVGTSGPIEMTITPVSTTRGDLAITFGP